VVGRNKKSGPWAGNKLENMLSESMGACPDAESLNNEVLIPFATALERICGKRGYVLNIYGETSNIIFTGDPDDSEEIYMMIENYLASRDESSS
tara:strand:- start:102 stop:383 length:282 start_codon:yes stop_codon:yes gene_type:complete